VQGNSRRLFEESYNTYKYTMWTERGILNVKPGCTDSKHNDLKGWSVSLNDTINYTITIGVNGMTMKSWCKETDRWKSYIIR
jgi:hypothetical protein